MGEQDKLILHLAGIAYIDEKQDMTKTVFFGQRWHLEMEGYPAALRDGDGVLIKVYQKAPEKGGDVE